MEHPRSFLPFKEQIFSRPRITELLEQGTEYPLTTVIAGPGYGKTMAVADFARSTKRSLAWLNLATLDNDVNHFWFSLVNATALELPAVARQLRTQQFPATPAAFETYMRTWARHIYAGASVLFVIDDYNAIHNEEVQRFVSGVLEQSIEGLSIILISNAKSNLNVDGLRQGGICNITMDDLRFTDDEVRAYFEFSGITLQGAEMDEIVAEADGWPLALQLLRMRLAGGKSLSLVHSHLELAAELFNNEYYKNYTPAFQKLLVRLALVPRFPIELVRRLGQNIDEEVAALSHNMFLTYDHRTRLFIFQKMYRSFLCNSHAMLSEEEKNHVWALAGDCFMQLGFFTEGLHSYWECRAYDKFLAAVLNLPAFETTASPVDYMLECLLQFPPEYRAAHPLVDYCIAYMHLGRMELVQCKEILLRLEPVFKADAQNPASRQVLGEIYAVLGDISFMQNTTEFARYYPLAHSHMPGGSRARNEGTLYLSNNSILFLPANEPGALEYITNEVQKASASLEAFSNGCGYGMELLFAAAAAFYTCRFNQAKESCYKAILKARRFNQADIICNAHMLLMRTALFEGSYPEALEQLETVRALVQQTDYAQLHELRDCMEAWFYIALGEPDKVARWITQDYPQATADQRGNLPIGHGRNRTMHAGYLVAKRQYVKALAFTSEMQSLFRQKGMWATRQYIHILRALCYMYTKQPAQAAEAFWQAYSMGSENNITALFAEQGNPMRSLIDLVRAHQTPPHAVPDAWLGGVYTGASGYAKQLAGVTAARRKEGGAPNGIRLTRREHEVLLQLAQGKTREEIARRLTISVNGVKKHVTGIYNKLGAINRADAIRIASARGDLAGIEDSV